MAANGAALKIGREGAFVRERPELSQAMEGARSCWVQTMEQMQFTDVEGRTDVGWTDAISAPREDRCDEYAKERIDTMNEHDVSKIEQDALEGALTIWKGCQRFGRGVDDLKGFRRLGKGLDDLNSGDGQTWGDAKEMAWTDTSKSGLEMPYNALDTQMNMEWPKVKESSHMMIAVIRTSPETDNRGDDRQTEDRQKTDRWKTDRREDRLMKSRHWFDEEWGSNM
ncbi:hypothetical protein BU17DRAFT_60076 [Hysterangium stoloniferum]|nr:hypothetical protein BU17DRAFT_60076 [Hysterangium stoloniferum]